MRHPYPEVLAVARDHSDNADRRAEESYSSLFDTLSVYLEGGPSYSINRRQYEIVPPVAFLIPKGTIDTDQQQGTIDGVFVLFDSHGLLSECKSPDRVFTFSTGHGRLSIPFIKELSVENAEKLKGLLDSIQEVDTDSKTASVLRGGLLLQAISLYCELPTRGKGVSVHREANRLRELIQLYACDNIPLSAVYSELELSAAHSEVLFQRAFHTTPVAFRTHLRMMKAREMLLSTGSNISQVAYQVGFADPLYFSRVFRKTFGYAPSALIAKVKNARKAGTARTPFSGS